MTSPNGGSSPGPDPDQDDDTKTSDNGQDKNDRP